ncbi:MAG: putative Sensor histidine kinase [Acidobacteriaceae bacterium]|nr:putative Sensor histidine kinase [Acidobacteriaceae bacterium]
MASVVTAVVLPFTVPQIFALVHEARTSKEHKRLLEKALAERNAAQDKLRKTNETLEQRVHARTTELAEANHALQAEIERRERIEEKLAELASIVEFSDDAIIGKSLNGIVRNWNSGAERIYGYTAADMVGKPISILAPADRADEMPEILARIANGESVHHYETVRVTKDRQSLDVSLTVSPIRNSQTEVIAASAIGRDITGRKQAEAALLKSEAQYRLLFDSSPVPMWVFDRETLAFLGVNEAAIRHYGFSQQEFMAMTILEIRPEEDIAAILEHVSHLEPGLQPIEIWRHKKKDGSILEVEITSYNLQFGEKETLS